MSLSALRVVVVAACAVLLQGCETLGYYLQAAGGQLEIARRAQNLDEVMGDPSTSAGTISAVVAEDCTPVQYGDVLFRIK